MASERENRTGRQFPYPTPPCSQVDAAPPNASPAVPLTSAFARTNWLTQLMGIPCSAPFPPPPRASLFARKTRRIEPGLPGDSPPSLCNPRLTAGRGALAMKHSSWGVSVMPDVLLKMGGRRYQALIERWGRPQTGTSERYLTHQLKCLWRWAALPLEALAGHPQGSPSKLLSRGRDKEQPHGYRELEGLGAGDCYGRVEGHLPNQ